MPQVSLYIDKETLEKIEHAAKAENISISKWVRKQVNSAFQTGYSSDFKDLFGSVNDDSFETPVRNSSTSDAPREVL